MSDVPAEFDLSTIALFLDVDGTLLDLRDNPGDVLADDGLIDLLESAATAVAGALSLISGREIAGIDRIFAPARFPAAGAHGSELRLPGGREMAMPSSPLPRDILDALRAFVGDYAGLLLEEKYGGVSLHYRRAPALERACRDIVHRLTQEVAADFRIIDGKMVLEIAPRSHSKGQAVRAFMTTDPFTGRRPVFVGDDVTDEDGFEAVNELDGISVRVGGAKGSRARYELADVAAVHDWLRRIAGAGPAIATTGSGGIE